MVISGLESDRDKIPPLRTWWESSIRSQAGGGVGFHVRRSVSEINGFKVKSKLV